MSGSISNYKLMPRRRKKSEFADAGIEPGAPGHPPPQCTTIRNSIASQRSSDLDEITLLDITQLPHTNKHKRSPSVNPYEYNPGKMLLY